LNPRFNLEKGGVARLQQEWKNDIDNSRMRRKKNNCGRFVDNVSTIVEEIAAIGS
jgi:hypothetical protein